MQGVRDVYSPTCRWIFVLEKLATVLGAFPGQRAAFVWSPTMTVSFLPEAKACALALMIVEKQEEQLAQGGVVSALAAPLSRRAFRPPCTVPFPAPAPARVRRDERQVPHGRLR